MKQDNVLIFLGIVLLLAAIFAAFGSNLSELAPVFLVLGLASFGWLMYRRTWSPAIQTVPPAPTPGLAKISTLLGLLGLTGIGLSGLSLLDPVLEEFAAAGILGGVLLIFALVVRIASNIKAKRTAAVSGSLSIAVIIILLVGLTMVCGFIYVVYVTLFD